MSKTIVMIHGMWGGAWYWENYRKFFEDRGFACHTPVLRYHDVDPGTPPDDRLGTTSLRDYAADLEQFVRGLDELPILMGHSMGGLIAQILASRGAARCAVLLTPASPWGINALKPTVIWSFLSVLLRWGFWKKPHRLSRRGAGFAMLHHMPPQAHDEIWGKMVYESGRAAAEIGFWPFDRRLASFVKADRVTCPVLVVAGAEDRITPPSVSRSIQNKYRKNATLMVFPGHAHWVVGEPGWETIAEAIEFWLQHTGLEP